MAVLVSVLVEHSLAQNESRDPLPVPDVAPYRP